MSGVSERTLQKDLNQIEDSIKRHNLPLPLVRKKGRGIVLKGLPHEKERLLTLLSTDQIKNGSNQDLQELIIFHILQNPQGKISLSELASQLYTTLLDLSTVDIENS